MRNSRLSWVRSQHPPTQWSLGGGRWSSVEKRAKKTKTHPPPPPVVAVQKKSLKRLEKNSSWVLLFRHQAPQFQIPVLADHQSYQPPPIPPLPLLDGGGGHMSAPPPRPPLPQEVVNGPPPPRPPMPDTDDEEGLFSSEPGSNRPIHMAAHGLYQEVKQVRIHMTWALHFTYVKQP